MRGIATATRVSILVATAIAVVFATNAVGATKTTYPVLPTVIKVTIVSNKAVLDTKAVERESVVQFKIHNTTSQRHVFTIGGQKVPVKAQGREVLLLAFDIRGKYPYNVIGAPKAHQGVLRVI